MTGEWLTVPEIADSLRLSRAFVYRLVEAGDLAGVRFGRAVRVSRAALDDYIRRNPARPACGEKREGVA